MPVQSKEDAQRRADQIGHFRAELQTLDQANILALDDGHQAALAAYHDKLPAELSSAYDIDASRQAKQLSLGMKIASFLGALGLAASVFFLFHQSWGRFGTGTLAAARREKTG